MSGRPIMCAGDHQGQPVVLGTFTPSPNGPQDHPGMLCDDCGPTYADHVARGILPAGTIPARVDVTAFLASINRGRHYP